MNDHQLGLIISCSVIENSQLFSDPVQNILNKVAKHFDKHQSYLFVKDRKPKRVYMRQICIYLLLQESLSIRDIANIFGVSPSVIWGANKTIVGLIDVDTDVRADLVKIRA